MSIMTKQKDLHEGNKRFGRVKWNKKMTIASVLAVVVLLVFVLPRFALARSKADVLDLLDTTVLAYTDIEDSISATGTVESASRMMVYSTQAYTVSAVYVEVGDVVEQGQLLAQLDDKMIQKQISSQEVSIETSKQSSAEQIKSAQANYDNYKYGLDNGLNASLLTAQSQVDTALQSYEKARLTYERYAQSLELDKNSAFISAETALKTAENSLASAQVALDDAKEGVDDAYESLSEAEDTLNQAYGTRREIRNARDAVQTQISQLEKQLAQVQSGSDAAKELEVQLSLLQIELESIEKSLSQTETQISSLKNTFSQLEKAYKSAQKQQENAERNLENAKESFALQNSSYSASVTGIDHTLQDYLTAKNNAWETYQDALVSLRAAQKSTQDQLQVYANTLSAAKTNANSAVGEETLRQLCVDLADTKITAPCSGTVTAVYAEVGNPGSGLLFVIEDVDHLVVETSVKGYDIMAVQPGMAVRITTDADNQAIVDGIISTIAPTANKNSQGITDTSGDMVFAAEVAVTTPNSGLRIGMEAQLDYIIGQQTDVLVVPYDAVYQNEQGQTCVLAALEQQNEKYLIQELAVVTGMHDELDIVISGAQIDAGLRVIHEPDQYRHLLGKSVLAATGLSGGMPMPGGFRGGGAS